MDPGNIAAILMGFFACMGVILTWVKNGKSQSEERGALKRDIKVLQKEVEHPEHGLSSIKKAVDAQKLLCAQVSTDLTARMRQVEKDTDDCDKPSPRRKK